MGSCVSSKSGEVYASQKDSLKNNSQSPSSQEGGVGGKKKRGPIYLGGSSKSSSKMSRLASAVISPSTKHTATVIFLHGLGDTGDGWCQEFGKGAHPWIKYVFPHAPAQPVTMNGGMKMPSWFDIKGLTPNAPQDEEGIKKSSDMLRALIDEEVKSIPSERIVIGGFSQGGAIALYTSLTSNIKLGGLLAFSTWLPLHTKVLSMVSDANKSIPILQCHGDIDPMVPFTWGNMTATILKQLNPRHEIRRLSGVMHSSSEEEMREAAKFLADNLSKQ